MDTAIVGYQMGDFYLDLQGKALALNDRHLELGERNFSLMVLLAESSPEPVSKQTLSERL